MKKLAALLLLLLLAASPSFSANTPPTGNPGDIQMNAGSGRYGPLTPRNGLVETASGNQTFLDVTITGGGGGVPAFPSGSLQYNNNGTFGALSVDTLAAYAAHDTVMNGLSYDPRNSGAICGGYNIFVSDGHTATYNYTIPFVGSSSSDNSNFFVYYTDPSGFGTATILTTSQFSVTGVNSGSGTITVNSPPANGQLIIVVHDDGPGIVTASTNAAGSGGYVSIPDGCTIYTSETNGTQLAEGAQLIGQGFTPNYGFQGLGIKPILNVIAPAGFAPEFGFNVSGKSQQFFEGFEITTHVPGYNGLGFLDVPVLIGANTSSGAGGGSSPGITAQYMTFNSGSVGFGSPIGGVSAYIFSTVRFSNFVANTVGIYGPLSDQVIVGNDFNSNGAFGSLGSAGGMVIGPQQGAPGASGAARIESNRFEFNREGVVTQSAALINFEGNQFDGNSACGLDLRGFWSGINITGGWFRGNANGGGSFPGNTASGQDAHICANSSNANSGGLTTANVNFINNYGEGNTGTLGTTCPSYGDGCATTPPYVLDVSTTGSFNNNIDIEGGLAPFGEAIASNASVTDWAIYRNGRPNNLKIDTGGQPTQGKNANGSMPSQSRGLAANSWTSFDVVGDAASDNNQFIPLTNGWGAQVGKQMGIGPTYYLVNDFSHYDCDVVNTAIIPNINPQTQDNAVVGWLPSAQNPGYGNGFYTQNEADTNSCRMGALTWMAIPKKYKIYAQNAASWTTSGAWGNSPSYGGALGITTSESGDTASVSITTHGGPVYFAYLMQGDNGGTFTYSLDGTTTGTVATQGNNAWTFPISTSTQTLGGVRIPAPAGNHTLSFAVTSTTSASNTVTLEAAMTSPSVGYHGSSPAVFLAGQINTNENAPQAAAVAAFNNDQQNQATQLFGDGLSVFFVPIQNYLDATADYINGSGFSKLNSNGQGHIAEAFNASMQQVPVSLNAVNPLDYGATCNTQFFVGANFYGGGNHQLVTTTSSPVISIANYTFQPETATQNGGGDVGKVFSAFTQNDYIQTTYIASVTTSSNTATLGVALGGTITSGANQVTFVKMGGYPSNPNDPSTAQDDTNAIQAAMKASNNQGGVTFLPPNCLIHNLTPPSQTALIGNDGGNYYTTGSELTSLPNTPVFIASTGFSDDIDTVTGLARTVGINTDASTNVRLSNFTIFGGTNPYFPMGQNLACIGEQTNTPTDLNPEHILLDHISAEFCPVAFNEPFGNNQEVDFTATISGTSMTVSAITSTNFSPQGGSFPADFLALGRTITGVGVSNGTKITAVPPQGGAGIYTVSLSQTVTSESMKSIPATAYTSGIIKNSQFGADGIAINGDLSDFSWESNIVTSAYQGAVLLGPSSGSAGDSANRFNLGRIEESGFGIMFDSTFNDQINGLEFQFNDGSAIITRGTSSQIQMTGGLLEGNGSQNSNAQDQAQIQLGGTITDFSIVGVNAFYENYSTGGTSKYLLETLTGATADYISVEGGSIRNGWLTGLSSFTPGGTPNHYKLFSPGVKTVDTTQSILSATTTGGVGIGTANANAGISLDALSETATTNSSWGLPNGTTANRPTTGITGMFRLNTTTSALEFYDQSQWNLLPSTTTVAPAPNYVLESTTTNGMGGQWLPVGTQTVLGSVTTANPSISGTTSSGLYATSTTLVGVEIGGSSIASWNSAGQTTTGALNILTASTIWNGLLQKNGEAALNLTNSSETGQGNTALGIGALPALGTRTYDTALGTWALHNLSNSVADNVAVGPFSGCAITSGANNIAIGLNSIGGSGSCALGVTGANNIGIGSTSLSALTSGANENIAIGGSALSGLTTGAANIVIGYSAGTAINGAASNNIVIGPSVWSSGTNYTGSNNIVIGLTTTTNPPSTGTSNYLTIGNLYEGDTSIFHAVIAGPTPTISSGSGDFGTAPSVTGNDNVGKVVIGSSPGGQGTVTFANPWTNAPDACFCQNNTTAARACQALAITTTSFALGATTSPFTGADQLGYECKSHRL